MDLSPGGVAKGLGRFAAEELLGIDDYVQAVKHLNRAVEDRDLAEALRALRSYATANFELGSTLIPGGALVKGAKAAKGLKGAKAVKGADILKSNKLYTKILKALPGATEAVEGGVRLTPRGLRGIQGLRAAETAQWADVGNTLLGQLGAPALPVGSIRGVRAAAQREALDADQMRGLGQAMMSVGRMGAGQYYDPAEEALRIVAAMRGGY